MKKRKDIFLIPSYGKTTLLNWSINMPILGLIANKTTRITTEQFKILKLNLQRCKSITFSSFTTPSGIPKEFKLIGNFHIPGIHQWKPVTSKGILVRMGKGKGKIKTHCFILTPGGILINFIITPITLTELKLSQNDKKWNIVLMSELKFLHKIIKKFPFLSIYKNF
jgi:hypothetical protein